MYVKYDIKWTYPLHNQRTIALLIVIVRCGGQWPIRSAPSTVSCSRIVGRVLGQNT